MKVVDEALDPKLLARTRNEMTPLHEALQRIVDDEAKHNQLRKIATFSLPAEKGKAQAAKQNMTNFYGSSPVVAGFVFSVARAVSGDEEYLGVQFVPELIEDGAWERYQEEKAEKAEEARVKKAEKAAAKAIEAKVAKKARVAS